MKNPRVMVQELLATGLTQGELAKRLPCTQSNISRIAKGEYSPRFDLGVAIEALHTELVTKAPELAMPNAVKVSRKGYKKSTTNNQRNRKS